MIRQVIRQQPLSAVAALTAAGYDEITARLLINRGCLTPEEAEAFINAENKPYNSPLLLPDMAKAVEGIKRAIREKRKITVYGDYDVDGITSISILYTYLKSIGVNVSYYIPNRLREGYGINKAAVDSIAADGTTMIITVDTGTTATEEIGYALSRGIDCVVTDHHECASGDDGKDLLPSCPVVNPKRADSLYPFKELAGVGVTYKLITALSDEATSAEYLPYTAIGTIADIMPLTGENRRLVTDGIAMLDEHTPNGIKALASASGCDGKPLDAGAVAFRIAPRLNAAGRIGDPSVSVRLLTAASADEAVKDATILCEENALRQKTENEILRDVEKKLAEKPPEKIIIESSDSWHNGVIGIVASRITDIYCRPCILFCSDGTSMKGSARSVPGVNIFELLTASASGLSKFGGHEMAAGLTVKEEDFEAFRRTVTEYADRTIPDTALVSVTEAECLICGKDISLETFDNIKRLRPFGAGNPLPAFALTELTVDDITGISQNKYSKLLLTDKTGISFTALNFSRAPSELSCTVGDSVNIICTVDENIYRGSRTVSVIIKTMELTELASQSDAAAEHEYQINKYTNFKNTGKTACEPVSRDDVAAVFRAVGRFTAQGINRISPLAFIRTLNRKNEGFNYFKFRLCLDILNEIGLVEHLFIKAKAVSEDEILIMTLLPQKKCDLSSSPTYRLLNNPTSTL